MSDRKWVAVDVDRFEHEVETKLDTREGAWLILNTEQTCLSIGFGNPEASEPLGRRVLGVVRVEKGKLVLEVPEEAP